MELAGVTHLPVASQVEFAVKTPLVQVWAAQTDPTG